MTPQSIEAVRAELEVRDAGIVRLLLGLPPETAPAPPPADAPEGEGGRGPSGRLAELRRELDAAYGAFLPPDFPAASAPALRASLWDRIAGGARVVEAKRQAAPELFAEAVRRADRAVLLRQITHPEVERQVVRRAVRLAARLQRPDAEPTVAALFRDIVIPMTRAVQVEWLLAAAPAGLPPAEAPP